MTRPTATLTTAAGAPVADNQNSLTAGARGPVLLEDVHLIEKLQHFNRERIPERVVHAKDRVPTARSRSRTTSRGTRRRSSFASIGKQTASIPALLHGRR